MADFRLALEDCSLGDLGFNGPRYTYTNKRTNGGLTLVRLDRVVANRLWCEQHKGAKVFVLAAQASDHNPIQITFRTNKQWYGSQKRNFKFEDRWWLDPGCRKIIKDVWEGTGVQEESFMAVKRNLE
jgi:hypothetical protein